MLSKSRYLKECITARYVIPAFAGIGMRLSISGIVGRTTWINKLSLCPHRGVAEKPTLTRRGVRVRHISLIFDRQRGYIITEKFIQINLINMQTSQRIIQFFYGVEKAKFFIH